MLIHVCYLFLYVRSGASAIRFLSLARSLDLIAPRGTLGAAGGRGEE